MTTILIAILVAQDACAGTCPSMTAHPDSIDHTYGKACRDCPTEIDVCFTYCPACEKSRNVCGGCLRVVGGRAIPVTTLWRGTDSSVEKPGAVRLTDAKSWKEAWSEAPAIDFEKEMVVAVYRGTNLQSSRAQEIRVLEFEKNIRVEFEWVAPVGKDEPKIREYLFVRIPKSSKPIEIVEYERGPSAVKRRVFAEIK